MSSRAWGAGCVSKLIAAFDFQCLEEVVDRRIISAVGVAAHRLQHPEFGDQLALAITRVLAAAVGMQDQSMLRLVHPIAYDPQPVGYSLSRRFNRSAQQHDCAMRSLARRHAC